MSKKWSRWLLAIVVAALGVMQMMPVDRTNPSVESDVGAPPEVSAILRQACYDCHSHETRWPWYGKVAPSSWILARHVEKGRGDLNFSQWPVMDQEALEHAFHDIEEQLEKGKMPLRSYKWLHPEARLTEEQRALLLQWARSSL